MALRSDVVGSPSIGSTQVMDPTFTAASILAGTANGSHRLPRNESSDRSASPGGSSNGDEGDGPPKKKKRRRRSAITGTLYFADDEPDPDAGLDPSRLSDTELKKSKGLDKKFPCDWPGCDKTFSRPDHLSRHRLNHEPDKIYTCDRCSKVFVRADLLTRHAERHDRREAAQAAGTSLQAANPHLRRAITTHLNPPKAPRGHRQQSSAPASSPLINSTQSAAEPPLSPRSGPRPLNGGAYPATPPTQAGFANPLPSSSMGSQTFAPAPSLPLPSSSAASGPSPSPATFGQPELGGLDGVGVGGDYGVGSLMNLPGFMAGQSMTLDAPFLSGQDFQWLFDGTLGDNLESISWNRMGTPLGNGHGVNSNTSIPSSRGLVPPMQSVAKLDPTLQQSRYNSRPAGVGGSSKQQSSGHINTIAPSPLSDATNESWHGAQTATSLTELGTPGSVDREKELKKRMYEDAMTVSEETRLKLVAAVREIPNLAQHPRFTTEILGQCLEFYWANVHDSSFPILHKPTFKTRTAYVPLLCCMICLGGYFMDAETHELASSLHEDMRKQIISSPEFRPRAELEMIQTTLLVILYGKLCSSRYHHEMAHILWGSTLTMYRRSALFAPRGARPPQELRNDLEAQWRAWIEEEAAKRAAYTAFLIDVQHAAIFRHAPTLSAFQIQHVLPADEEEWAAPTARAWHKLHSQPQPAPAPFMSALKASLMPGMAPPFLNPFSRVVLLHGLISVAFDMQWRDVFFLGLAAPDGPVKDWRETISAAFNCWKSRLDSCLVSSSAPAHQLLRASISLYALGHVVLSIDVHELQIYAGAQKALGLVVAQHVIESTRDRVWKWALSKDGRASTWHAAHFLRSSLIHLSQSTELLHCLHYTWACYISVLTVYAYGRALSGPPPPWEPTTSVRTVEAAMRYLDAMCTQSPDSLPIVQTKHHSLPLIAAVYDVIKTSRWEIALEGARILQRLMRSVSV